MGMYDEIICSIPLPGTKPDFVKDRHTFQTKDLDCELAVYEITGEGHLDQIGHGFDSTIELPRRLVIGTLTLEFYSDNCVMCTSGMLFTRNGEDYEEVEYEAEIVNGLVQSIKQTGYERKRALASSVVHERELALERPTINLEEPEINAILHVVSFTDPNYLVSPVVLLAKTDIEFTILEPEGHMIVISRHNLGKSLFASKEDAERINQWRKSSVEQERQYLQGLLESHKAATTR